MDLNLETMMRIPANTRSLLLAMTLFPLLVGCEGPRTLLYNKSACTIKVTYIAANIRNRTVSLPPGEAVGATGISAPDLEDLRVVDGAGQLHHYSNSELAVLRR